MSAYGGGTSIVLSGSAALGSTVEINGNLDYSGSTPAQVKTLSLATDTLTGTIAQFNTACSDSNFVDDTSTQTIGGTKTFSSVIKNSSATSLEIATGGGSTLNAINI